LAAAGKLAGKTNIAVNATKVNPSAVMRTLRRIDVARPASSARDVTRAAKFTVFPDSCAQLLLVLCSTLPRLEHSRADMDVPTAQWMTLVSSVVTAQ
jgi:hypothetical protein